MWWESKPRALDLNLFYRSSPWDPSPSSSGPPVPSAWQPRSQSCSLPQRSPSPAHNHHQRRHMARGAAGSTQAPPPRSWSHLRSSRSEPERGPYWWCHWGSSCWGSSSNPSQSLPPQWLSLCSSREVWVYPWSSCACSSASLPSGGAWWRSSGSWWCFRSFPAFSLQSLPICSRVPCELRSGFCPPLRSMTPSACVDMWS